MFSKFRLGRLASILLVLALLVAPVQAVVDQGHPALTRLWVPTADGDQFACTGFYVNKDAGDARRTWVLSAGHCSRAAYAARNADETSWYAIDWRMTLVGHGSLQKRLDIAIGTMVAPDAISGNYGKRFWLADKFPEDGRVYIPNFGHGVESVIAAKIKGPDPRFPGAVIVETETAGQIKSGASGSPVLNSHGRVAGVLWGGVVDTRTMEPTNEIIVTPIEVAYALWALMEVRP